MMKENEKIVDMDIKTCENGYVISVTTKCPNAEWHGVTDTEFKSFVCKDKTELKNLIDLHLK